MQRITYPLFYFLFTFCRLVCFCFMCNFPPPPSGLDIFFSNPCFCVHRNLVIVSYLWSVPLVHFFSFLFHDLLITFVSDFHSFCFLRIGLHFCTIINLILFSSCIFSTFINSLHFHSTRLLFRLFLSHRFFLLFFAQLICFPLFFAFEAHCFYYYQQYCTCVDFYMFTQI